MLDEWEPWRPFPDSAAGGMLIALIGPGINELRLRASGCGFLSAAVATYRKDELIATCRGAADRATMRESEQTWQSISRTLKSDDGLRNPRSRCKARKPLCTAGLHLEDLKVTAC